MSNRKKQKYKALEKQQELERQEQMQEEADKKADFRASLVIFYFVLCLFLTSLATDRHIFTRTQMSIVYMPMFFLFIYWLMQRMKDTENQHGRMGNIIGIALCIVVIVLTTACWIASLLGIF